MPSCERAICSLATAAVDEIHAARSMARGDAGVAALDTTMASATIESNANNGAIAAAGAWTNGGMLAGDDWWGANHADTTSASAAMPDVMHTARRLAPDNTDQTSRIAANVSAAPGSVAHNTPSRYAAGVAIGTYDESNVLAAGDASSVPACEHHAMTEPAAAASSRPSASFGMRASETLQRDASMPVASAANTMAAHAPAVAIKLMVRRLALTRPSAAPRS